MILSVNTNTQITNYEGKRTYPPHTHTHRPLRVRKSESHSHGHTGSEAHLRPTPQLEATPDPPSTERGQRSLPSSWVQVGFISPVPQGELPSFSSFLTLTAFPGSLSTCLTTPSTYHTRMLLAFLFLLYSITAYSFPLCFLSTRFHSELWL